MMRIFTKKALIFEHEGASFRTQPLAFSDMPDHFSKCLLFQWALKDGDIEVIDGAKAQRRAEREPGKPTAKRAKEET